jgi:uncharacterized C2H2 Zn-finger protein
METQIYECMVCNTIFKNRGSYWKHINKKKTSCISRQRIDEILKEKDSKIKDLETSLLEIRETHLKEKIKLLEKIDEVQTKSKPLFGFTLSLLEAGITMDMIKNEENLYKQKKFIVKHLRTIRNVPEKLKKVIAHGQEYICNDCNDILPPEYEIDHIKPLFLGGDNAETNLAALCRNCHGAKTTKDLLTFHQCVMKLRSTM